MDPNFTKWLEDHSNEIELKCADDQPVPRENVSEQLFRIPVVKDYVEQGISAKCIKSQEGLIPIPTKWDKNEQYDIMHLTKGFKLYKGMESFATPDQEAKFFEKAGALHPTWVGHPYIAAQFAAQNHGGIHVYKTAKLLKFLVWNSENIERLYALLCDFQQKKGGIYDTIKKAFQISIGIDIPYHLRMQYINYLDHTDSKTQVCITKDAKSGELYCDGDFKGLKYYFRKYTHHVFVFKYFVFPLLLELKLDGVFVPQHKNPIQQWGHWTQEIILLDSTKCLTRLTDDPLDWMFYRKYMDFKVPDTGFMIVRDAAPKNKNYQMMKWYLKMQTAYQPSFRKPAGALVVCSLNVHGFEPILQNSGIDVIEKMIELMTNQTADIVVLHEVAHYHLKPLIASMTRAGYTSHSRLENWASIVFAKTKVIFQDPVQIGDIDRDKGILYKRYATFFTARGIKMCATHLSIGSYTFKIKDTKRVKEIQAVNSAQRISELNNIIAQNPDFIIGDLNFTPDDPEYKHLTKAGYVTDLKDIKETTPFGSIVDYIFVKKTLVKKCTFNAVSFPYSDHYAVMCTLGDFYTTGGADMIPPEFQHTGSKFYSGTPTPLYTDVHDIPQTLDRDTKLLYSIMSSPDLRLTVSLKPIKDAIKVLKLDTQHAFKVFYHIASQNTEMSMQDIKSIWPPDHQELYFSDRKVQGITTIDFGQTVIVAKMILNKNSLDFIKYQNLERYLLLPSYCWRLINAFAKYIDTVFDPHEREQIVAYHGMLSYILGLRRFNDIDILWGGKPTDKFSAFNQLDVLNFGTSGVKTEAQLNSMQCRFRASTDIKEISQLWTDPNEYGYFMGIKFLKLKTNIGLRLLRQRPKAMAELVVLKQKYPAIVPRLTIPSWKIDEQNTIHGTITSIMENQFVCFFGADGNKLTAEEIEKKRTPVDQKKYQQTLLNYLYRDFGVNITSDELATLIV